VKPAHRGLALFDINDRRWLEALDGGRPADVSLPTELVVRASAAALRP